MELALPVVGADIAGLIGLAITALGAIVAGAMGGYTAFLVVRKAFRWIGRALG